MLIEKYFFAAPSLLRVEDMLAYTNKASGRYRQQPQIILGYMGSDLIQIDGKSLMWDMIDSLFETALPRGSLSQDIFHPDESTPHPAIILNNLLDDSDAHYLCFEVEKGSSLLFNDPVEVLNVVSVRRSDDAAPDMSLKGIGDVVNASEDWKVMYVTMPYHDKISVHQREAIVFSNHNLHVIAQDIGNRMFVYSYVSAHGIDVRPTPCTLVKKSEDFFFDIASDTVKMHMSRLISSRSQIENYDWSNESSTPKGLRSSEADWVGNQRWVRLS